MRALSVDGVVGADLGMMMIVVTHHAMASVPRTRHGMVIGLRRRGGKFVRA